MTLWLPLIFRPTAEGAAACCRRPRCIRDRVTVLPAFATTRHVVQNESDAKMVQRCAVWSGKSCRDEYCAQSHLIGYGVLCARLFLHSRSHLALGDGEAWLPAVGLIGLAILLRWILRGHCFWAASTHATPSPPPYLNSSHDSRDRWSVQLRGLALFSLPYQYTYICFPYLRGGATVFTVYS